MPILINYYNVVEAAEVLGIHPGTVKRLCREGRLEAEKVHNAWLIHSDVLNDFAEKYVGRRGRPQSSNIKIHKKLTKRLATGEDPC